MQKVFLKTLFCLLSAQVVAQTATVSAGGDSKGDGGSVSASVGQVFYQSSVSATGSVTEGIQQYYEISIITGSEDKNFVLSTEVYPNPVTDILKLTVAENHQPDNLTYSLTDVKGNIITQEKITGKTTLIQMSEKVNGAYLVSVFQNQKAIKTFKIIKNH